MQAMDEREKRSSRKSEKCIIGFTRLYVSILSIPGRNKCHDVKDHIDSYLLHCFTWSGIDRQPTYLMNATVKVGGGDRVCTSNCSKPFLFA